MINHSGIGTYLKNMIPNLVGNYKVALLGNAQILQSFSWTDQVTIFNADYPIYSLSEQLNLTRHVPESRLFISPHYNIPLRNIAADKRLVIIHDVNHLVNINKISSVKKLYARFMINAAIKKSDRIITDSYFSQKEIAKHISTNGKVIKVIHCCINGDEIRVLANRINHEEFRQKYNLPQSYFLYVGSIKRHKNLIFALKAFSLLIKKYPTQKLVVVGVKQDEFINNKEVNDLRASVIVPGYISDDELPAVYANALCLVFPSLYEGFGLPPLEAMSCGCPVIASSFSSIPEVCSDAALYFDPLNIDEIVKRMQQIIQDENIVVQLRENGFKNLKRFTWQKFGQNLKDEIDNLIIK